MFRPKSPQKSLFDIGSLLPKKKLSQLERTWAGPFREKVLPLIDEYAFRDFYDQRMGAPNKAVQTVIGLLIIKERPVLARRPYTTSEPSSLKVATTESCLRT
jgi:hypothetical protein